MQGLVTGIYMEHSWRYSYVSYFDWLGWNSWRWVCPFIRFWQYLGRNKITWWNIVHCHRFTTWNRNPRMLEFWRFSKRDTWILGCHSRRTQGWCSRKENVPFEFATCAQNYLDHCPTLTRQMTCEMMISVVGSTETGTTSPSMKFNDYRWSWSMEPCLCHCLLSLRRPLLGLKYPSSDNVVTIATSIVMFLPLSC